MSGHEYQPDDEGRFRETAPMQGYDIGEVTVGIVVLLIGLAITFGVPFLLA